MSNNFFSGLFGKKKKQKADGQNGEQQEMPEESSTPSDALPTISDVQENADAATPSAEAAIASERPPEQPSEPSPEPAPQSNIATETTPQETAPKEAEPTTEETEKKKGWLSRLSSGLSKSSDKIADGVTSIFNKRRLDDDTLEELHDLLITSDLGVAAAERITDALAQDKFEKEISDEEIHIALAEEVAETLTPLEKPLAIDAEKKPHVILMIGVNGSGKTTTIGKLAEKYKAEGRNVMLAAGDTFRAAAIEQLTVWGERAGVPVVARDVGADAAGVAFDAVKEAQEGDKDVLIVDTAGRLQNKAGLMEELAKVVRVIKKIDETAPHDVVLVLDATVGQNAISQAQAFSDIAGVTGLIMTKLDGTARGGVLVALADKFGLPIHYIGVGEGVDDLQPFHAQSFARALAGVAE